MRKKDLGEYELLLDPNRDYQPVKIHAVRETGHPELNVWSMEFCESTTTVSEFKKIGGHFFPSKAHREFSIKRWMYTRENEITTEYSSVTINEPLGPDTFTLKFPAGTSVYDFRSYLGYTVDEAGNMVLKEGAKEAAEERRKEEQEQAALIGKEAPEIEAEHFLNSQPIKLADLHGLCVLLEFSSLGCGGCRSLMPKLERHHRNPDLADIRIICIHTRATDESDVAQVKEFCEENGITYPVILDAKAPEGHTWGKSFSNYHVNGLPETVLIGPDGKVVARGWFYTLLFQARQLLREKKGAE